MRRTLIWLATATAVGDRGSGLDLRSRGCRRRGRSCQRCSKRCPCASSGATLLHTLTSGIVGYYWVLGLVRGKVGRYLAIGIPVAAVLACHLSTILYLPMET